MTATGGPKFLCGSLFVITLLAGVVLWSGCGSDGAGTMHIESPRARKLMMRTGAGTTPTATTKPSASGAPPKAVPRTATKNRVPKKH
jgi:hypothetical protein